MKLRHFLLALVLVPLAARSQQQVIHLERFRYSEVSRALLRDTASFTHTAMKPVLVRKVDTRKVTGYAPDSVKYYYWVSTAMLRDHLVSIRSGDFSCTIDPLFDFGLGRDDTDTSKYADTTTLTVNTRGLLIQADFGRQFSFQSGFYETQTYLPSYQKAFVDSLGVVPGMGRTKAFKRSGFDYSMSFGVMSYSPADWVNLQMGYGKQFIGFGYRSLLLSDAAFNYPFLRAQVSSSDGRLEYTTIGASLSSLRRLPPGEVPESLFQRKTGTYHYLSFKPSPRVELGLFEGTIWQRLDSTGTQPLAWPGYLPMIGLSSMVNGLDDPKHNVLTGFNARLAISRHLEVYGQIALDSWSRRKSRMGYQAGIRGFNLAVPNLDLQVEWNRTTDYMYTHSAELQSYSHYNQPLGHPGGPGLQEWVVLADYRYRRVVINARFNAIRQSSGPGGHWRDNPEGTNALLVAYPQRKVSQLDVQGGLYLNPKTNARLLLGYIWREEKTGTPGIRQTHFIYLTFRTVLHNRYFDF